MENGPGDLVQIPARKLAGLLADESRLRVVAALALGAGTIGELSKMTGLEASDLNKAVARLRSAGLVGGGDSVGYELRVEAFREAARRDRDPVVGSGALEAMVRNGRLPKVHSDRLAVLRQLADLFEFDRRYPEAEVNSRLRVVNPDYALLRRCLVDSGFLQRANETAPGGHTVVVYWRTAPGQAEKNSEKTETKVADSA